jgi:hypothetical protein
MKPYLPYLTFAAFVLVLAPPGFDWQRAVVALILAGSMIHQLFDFD